LRSTINDVAKLAGVSKSTVSRVLNNSGSVSPQAREAVLKAQRALNYHPNRVARSLVSRSTMTIGVLVPDLRNPFYSTACWAAEKEMRQHGYSALICNTDNNPDLESKYLQVLGEHQVDGVLVLGGSDNINPLLNFKARENMPLVFVDRPVLESRLPWVGIDNVRGGMLASEYLLDLGHRRILFATSDFTKAERDRGIGYKNALAARGIAPNPDLYITIEEDCWKRQNLSQIVKLFNREARPTAIFASNDLKALTLYNVLKEIGLGVSSDVSIIGFDNIDVTNLVSPPLTTVAQPIAEMSKKGTEMLLAWLKGEEMIGQAVEMEPRLVVRKSATAVA